MKAYRALIKGFPDSPYVPDAWMAFGEYYFDRANKGDRAGNLKKALESYKKAASYQESSVYGYALYKQGWVQFNLGNFPAALDLFRAVIYFGELPTSSIPADRKLALVKEARKDYVRTWPHVGSAEAAFEDFRRVGGEAGTRNMIRTLGDIYWTDGQDREAIVYHRLIKQDPVAPDAPFLQSRIVTMAGRMGKKEVAVQQAHLFVKILEDFEASPRGKDPANAKLTAEARSTAENTLRYLALRYHNEWKKSDDQAVAGYAISVYADYLEVFGASPAAYEMRFFHAELLYALGKFAEAGDEYDRVVILDVAAMEGKSKQARSGETGARPASGSTTPSRARSSPTRRRSRPCRPWRRHRPARRSGWPWPPSGSSSSRPTSASCAGAPTASWPPRRPTAPPSSPTTTTTTPRPSTSSPGWRWTTPPARRRSTPPTWCSTPTTSWATGGTSTPGPSASTPTRRWWARTPSSRTTCPR